MAKTIEALVDAGQATPGPPLGPALGPLGVNIKRVIDEINIKTQNFKGMKVPVKVEVDDQRNFTITE
jgi:large subunit ribosomal protein L11